MQDEEADEISIITYSTVHMTQPKHNKNIDFFYQDADDASSTNEVCLSSAAQLSYNIFSFNKLHNIFI